MNLINKIYMLILVGIVLTCQVADEPIEPREYFVPVFGLEQSTFTDEELLNAAYSDYFLPPDVIYQDLGDTALLYITTGHIDSLPNGIELSSNSKAQVREWVEEIKWYEEYVIDSGIVTEQHIEFNMNWLDYNYKFRVYWKPYFTMIKKTYSTNNPDTVGILNQVNFTGKDAKNLVDYLFTSHIYDNRRKLLSSFSENRNDSIDVFQYIVYLNRAPRGAYDTVYLYKITYSISKATGHMIWKGEDLGYIEGEYNDN